MDNPSDRDRNAATREAATWFAILLDEATPQTDYQLFREWLLADEKNAQAYARIERLWADAALEPSATEVGTSRRNLLKMTSGVVLLAGAGGTLWTFSRRPDFSTGTGEMRSVSLADGSQVQLGAASAMSVDFTTSKRRIILLGGEAYFSVAADSQRPFIVEAGDLKATALGTAYSVSIAPQRTSVAVTQHHVRVEANGKTINLAEGDAVDWQDGMLGSVIKGEAENRLRWRDRQLVFLARPLGEVIVEVNRWRKGRLVITDRSLAARTVTAILDVNDILDIDKTLEQGLPVSLHNYTSLLTIVTARN